MSAAPSRLAEIDELFAAALEAEPAERAALLAAARERDPDLVAEVEPLLAVAEPALEDPGAGPWRTGALLAGPLAADLAQRLGAEEGAPGERFGAYRLVREIGRGGMAVVYLAERADGAFTQQVALKLLQHGMGGREVVRRFEQERQILATLQHPAIARLLDGGVDERGRPFLVLEYVDGRPIDRDCDERQRSLDERLTLFAEVARAVEHAHRRLVIHRDLKPSNILVAADGAVKLLDFGIAKLLDSEVAGDFAAPPTRTHVRLMTPEYASPEQIDGMVVTTASDVYQLGLLLYELLTGTQPHRRPSRSPGSSPPPARAAAEIERAIREEEPPRPSAVVRAAPPAVAAARRSTPAALSRRLAGDLDNIVLMALRKEPERRYAAVGELLDELERHRDGLPVKARQPTAGYRLGKFARRHRFALATAVAGLLLLVGYATTVTVQAAAIARERDRARAEAAKAETVKDLLTHLFEVSDPDEARGREITARELLDRSRPRVESELASQPAVQAAMLGTLGEVYHQLGLYGDAEPLLRRSEAVARTLGASGRRELVESCVRRARLLRDQGDSAGAETLLREALALCRQPQAGESLAEASTLRELALTLQARGELEPATALFREALAAHEKLLGHAHPEVARDLGLLANNRRRQGDLVDAERLLRESLALRRQLLPADHPDSASALNDLAVFLLEAGRAEEAEPLLREALAIDRRVLGEAHPETATALANVAQALWGQGRFAEAEPLLHQALEIRRAALGDRHPAVAVILNTLGRVQQDGGDLAAAERSYREALARYPADHPWRPITQFNLATLLEARHRYAEAESLYREVLAVQRAQLGADHATVAFDLLKVGAMRFAQRDPAAAEPLMRQALATMRQKLPSDHPRIAQTLLPLARLLAATGRAAEAEPLLREALALRRARFGDADPRTREAELALEQGLAALKAPPARRSPDPHR